MLSEGTWVKLSPSRGLIQVNRKHKVFRYLNTHLALYIRGPKFKEQITHVIFHCATELNPRGLELCGNKLSLCYFSSKCFPGHCAYLSKNDKGA